MQQMHGMSPWRMSAEFPGEQKAIGLSWNGSIEIPLRRVFKFWRFPWPIRMGLFSQLEPMTYYMKTHWSQSDIHAKELTLGHVTQRQLRHNNRRTLGLDSKDHSIKQHWTMLDHTTPLKHGKLKTTATGKWYMSTHKVTKKNSFQKILRNMSHLDFQ